MQTSLPAMAKKAQENKDLRFFNLYRLLDESLLLDCWRDIRKEAAYGVDGISAREYGETLIENSFTRQGFEDLLEHFQVPRPRIKVRPCAPLRTTPAS